MESSQELSTWLFYQNRRPEILLSLCGANSTNRGIDRVGSRGESHILPIDKNPLSRIESLHKNMRLKS